MSSSKTTISEIGDNLNPWDVGKCNFFIPLASNPDVYEGFSGYYTTILNKTYDANKEKYDKDPKALNFTVQLYPQEAAMLSSPPLVTNIYLSDNHHDRDNIFVKLFNGRDSFVDTRPTLDYKRFYTTESTHTGKITNARMEWGV
nr:MAG TPA: hypothetical protein [Caudoviricetes sp.]